MEKKKKKTDTVLAFVVSAVGLFFAGSTTFIVATVLPGALAGDYAMATKIVDALMAGATIAAAVGLVVSGGLSAAAMATVRWAIKTFGKKQAIK